MLDFSRVVERRFYVVLSGSKDEDAFGMIPRKAGGFTQNYV